MDNFWINFIFEILLFIVLGVLYYLYQKRKIGQYEQNKTPLVMGYILQCCLTEKGEDNNHELTTLIESLDDYLQNKITTPPLALLVKYSNSAHCSEELKSVIEEGLKELQS
ncbi:MAG: hypothetical protein AB7I27_03970 [Bacteriovoracaceae bacterium]